jgi:hypothetical protein
MKSELLEPGIAESAEANQPRQLPIDWAESEWFAVWLRLARGEYHPETEPVAMGS